MGRSIRSPLWAVQHSPWPCPSAWVSQQVAGVRSRPARRPAPTAAARCCVKRRIACSGWLCVCGTLWISRDSMDWFGIGLGMIIYRAQQPSKEQTNRRVTVVFCRCPELSSYPCLARSPPPGGHPNEQRERCVLRPPAQPMTPHPPTALHQPPRQHEQHTYATQAFFSFFVGTGFEWQMADVARGPFVLKSFERARSRFF